jgi:predicted aspartyl protease
MRECLFISAALVLLATPRLWAASTTTFTLGAQGGVLVPVMVNGSGPFIMLLDTGATHSAISENVAAIAGAKAVAKSTVISPAGETVRTIVSIDRLVVGPISADHVLPSVVAAGSFDAEGRIHGLIGQDVLAWLRYTLDFKRRVVEWHDEAPPRNGVALDLAYEHGRFLVNLPQRDTTLRLIPDSGAGGLVLFNAAGRASHNIVDTGETVQLATAHASRRARQVRIRELRFGDRTMRDMPAVSIERADPRPAEGDGLLPLHLFERVTFDGPARLLILGRIQGPPV